MRKYEKPIAVVNSNLAEGVYAASGCYTATASIHQTPDGGGQGRQDGQHDGRPGAGPGGEHGLRHLPPLRREDLPLRPQPPSGDGRPL